MLITHEKAIELNRDMKQYLMKPVRHRAVLALSEHERTLAELSRLLGWPRHDLAKHLHALQVARIVAARGGLTSVHERYRLTDRGIVLGVLDVALMGEGDPAMLFANSVRAQMPNGWECGG